MSRVARPEIEIHTSDVGDRGQAALNPIRSDPPSSLA